MPRSVTGYSKTQQLTAVGILKARLVGEIACVNGPYVVNLLTSHKPWLDWVHRYLFQVLFYFKRLYKTFTYLGMLFVAEIENVQKVTVLDENSIETVP